MSHKEQQNPDAGNSSPKLQRRKGAKPMSCCPHQEGLPLRLPSQAMRIKFNLFTVLISYNYTYCKVTTTQTPTTHHEDSPQFPPKGKPPMGKSTRGLEDVAHTFIWRLSSSCILKCSIPFQFSLDVGLPTKPAPKAPCGTTGNQRTCWALTQGGALHKHTIVCPSN